MRGSVYVEYDGKYYNSKELYEFLDSITKEGERREVEKIISLRNLADILAVGGMPRLARKVAAIADVCEKIVAENFYSSVSEFRQMRNQKKYVRKLGNDRANLHNAKSSIGILLSKTLDSQTISEISYEGQDLSLYVDSCVLTTEECKLVAKNFKRLYSGKELIPYAENAEKGRTR